MSETNDLPRRFFALGHEPVGLRVSPYHKPGALGHILDSLEADEIEILKRSPFGRFIELADKTPYSGRLGRYMLSRQLKVRKKYEAWFLFAENPIRFSLREFAIVTGLPCGKYPKQPQKELKNMITEQPYYTTLFGMLKEVTATSVIRMLKRKTITDRDTRIKYACLAILASVLLPTTHVPKILVEHAEKIRDLDEFFSYPWGRVSFEMLMSSIKERDEVALSQNTIALQGYVQALQMVMTKAVPALTEVVSQDSSTDAAGDDDGDFAFPPPKNGIKPAHARTLDTADNVRVTLIIPPDTGFDIDEDELCYSEDEDDVSVDKIVSLIRDGASFAKNMFIGGATNDDVERMRQEAEAEALAKKKRKRKTPCQTDHPRSGEVNPAVVDPATDCNIQQTTSQCNPMTPADDTAYIDRVVASVLESHGDANAEGPGTENATPAIGGDTDMINEDTNITQKTPAEDNINVESHDDEQNVDVDESSDGEPSEAGSEDEHMSSEDVETHIDDEAPPPVPEADQTNATEADQTDATIPIRKSTRLKAVTKSLVGVYHCDKLILNRFREAQLGAINKDTATDLLSKFSKLLNILKTTKSITVDGITVTNKDIQDLAGRGRALSSKMVDVLMHHSQVITSQLPNTSNRCCFLNTKFVSILSKNYSRFNKCIRKDEFAFTPNAVEFLGDPEVQAFESSRFYLPFNFDRNYWTGLCVDSTTWTLTVLDCNASIRNDSAMTKELTPICQMFPYLLKQAGRNMCPRELRALTIERPRTIPQNLKTTDSGVMTALLMLAHAVAGLEACNYLTPEALDQEAKRLAVMIYEENTGSI
ncbi:hypothetical protein Rs2_05042 [Raphanus sativus]|nr:hypothetical protein Rs2_05042 [Raphanus sativus]